MHVARRLAWSCHRRELRPTTRSWTRRTWA
jgi:hypothetical protein